MIIEKLDWDSEFFGINIGKLTIYDSENFNPIHFKEQVIDGKYNLVYVFKYQTMLVNEKLMQAELDLVDIQLVMSKILNKEDYLNFSYDFRTQLSDTEKIECYGIAEETSIVSRFYNEKNMGPEKTKGLYRKWIDNALNKTFSDGLFIFRNLKNVVGIHLIKTDEINNIGYFTLTGVNPTYKRMGIGKKLWNQSFSYFLNEKKIEIIRSPFSLQNIESCNFHLKMGFNKVEEVKYIYHYRNKL